MFQTIADFLGSQREIDPVSSTTGGYGITGTAIDMTGWEGCLFIISLGAMTALGTFDAKVQSAAALGFGTAHDVAGAALTQVLAASGANKIYAIDVRMSTALAAQSGDRYLRLAAQTDGTHSVLVSAVALPYRRNGSLPVATNFSQAVPV